MSGSHATELPVVTVVTPTWDRHYLLLDRCVPSVQAQDYPNVEHVIVSDGPDSNLRDHFRLNAPPNTYYWELPAHDPAEHWGHHARLLGIKRSQGKYITYCDDDDALRPLHCALMAVALEAAPEAGFAVSRMVSHGGAHKRVYGWGALARGNLGTPMIMHRREILEHGTWGPASFTEDFDLVERWLDAGVTYVNVNTETSDVYPSLFQGSSAKKRVATDWRSGGWVET
jgi:glycosyltransferase involved in cell wall biosynthesis